jgi:hypothetical protein
MAHALGCSRTDVLLRHMADPAPAAFAPLVARRAAHEPVAYIVGTQEFYGLDLVVSPAVLIPRGDSETLIEAAREAFAARPAPVQPAPARILDLGTGSGACCWPHCPSGLRRKGSASNAPTPRAQSRRPMPGVWVSQPARKSSQATGPRPAGRKDWAGST